MNKDLRPEDFWPEAEKLLDKHYNARRKRRAILWFITALTIIGASIYFISDRSENTTAFSGSENKSTTELKDNSTEINNTLQKEKTIQSSDKIKANPTISNSTSDEISKNKSEKRESKTEKESTSIKKLNPEKTIAKPTAILSSSLTISTNNKSTPISQTGEPVVKSESSENLISTSRNGTPESSGIVSLSSPLFDGLKLEGLSIQTAATRNTQVQEPKIKSSAEYRFDVLAGANLITKEISDYSILTTEGKRNAGESDVVTPQLSLEVSRVTEKYTIALGLNYIQYGEKVNYDPSTQTKIAIDNSYWNTFTTNVVDTDTNYVYGFVYLSQQTIQQLDSNYVTQTDSLDQTVINNAILKSAGTNVISYVEMPITVSYYFGRKKFRYGISAGVSAGMLVYSNGYYLNNSGTDVINIRDEKLFKKVIFNGQVGLDFRYCLSPKTHLLFRPQYRMNLDSIIKEGNGFNQRYSSFGVSAGVSFLIK